MLKYENASCRQKTGSRQYYELCGHASSEPISESPKARKFKRWKQAKLWAIRTKRNDYGLKENPGRILDPKDQEYVNPPRECICGSARYGKGSVAVVDDGKDGHYRDIARCGSVWTCPICGSIIRKKRAEEINKAIIQHIENGGGLLLMTETIQHHKGHKLESLIDILKKSHREMTARRSYKNIRNNYGIIGYISSMETPYGLKNGWHPHQHFLIFTDKPVNDSIAHKIKETLYPVWSKSIGKNGGYSDWKHGLDIQVVKNAEAAGQYLAKIAQEMTNINDMKNCNGSITPFQLLDEPTRENELLFREYSKAVKGKAAIRWSRGLRDKLGLPKEKTDVQLANEEKPGSEKALISREVWTKIKNDIYLQDTVRDAILSGDDYAAAAIMGCRFRYHLVIDKNSQPGFIPIFYL